MRRAARGRKVVDVLVKVWRRSGEETRVLVHAEVQSQVVPGFDVGMLVKNTLLFARNACPVAIFAILGDTQADWRPNAYGYALWGCEVGIRFPVVKLIDISRGGKNWSRATIPSRWW